MRSVEPTTGPLFEGGTGTSEIEEETLFDGFVVKLDETTEVFIAEDTICFDWGVFWASFACHG